MAENFYTILTDIGKAKVANSAGFGTKVNVTKYKIGDGGGKYYEPTETQKDLINPVYEGKINSIKIDEENSNWICFELALPANIGGFFIREYGIFDDSGDMIAIAKCPESYKPLLADGSSKEMILELIISVSNVESVKLEIDKTLIFVTKNIFDSLSDEIFPNNEVITINHNLKCCPFVRLIVSNGGLGLGALGTTPLGGESSFSAECKTQFLDIDNIKIYVPKKYFFKNPSLIQVTNTQYILTFSNSVMSILIDLIKV